MKDNEQMLAVAQQLAAMFGTPAPAPTRKEGSRCGSWGSSGSGVVKPNLAVG